MRAGNGTESAQHRGDGKAGSDRLHPVDGRRDGDGSFTETEGSCAGAGGANRGDERDVTKAPWFNPVDEISECPGGVCPVPWAVVPARPVIQEDVVNHPSHYTDGGIECIEAIEAQLSLEEYRGYLKGNIAKYVWRESHKGGTESLKKARWYLDRLIGLDEI